MISVVLYGRNDSHGYNLHKRGAISLNCIAEMLTDPDDEIIFVDYNSPDQIPTFPEAIADTLTDRAVSVLRIIRVREAWHRKNVKDTHLVALESQSRNIAVRRANPANRWILSTNTDMIFVPRHRTENLTTSIARLDDGFYHLPRFEIPESLWETLDRRDPVDAMLRVADWGRSLHLNEVVFGGYDNLYEAPGDFQLFVRADLEAIGGFDESMVRGWHVDSNIARRMKLFRGEVRSAVDSLFGYHCGHTRQPTSLHRSGFVANSLDTYVNDVTDPVLHGQLRNWGAAGFEFEERRIVRSTATPIESALLAAIPNPGPELSEVTLNNDSFDQTTYDPSHVMPHLVNLLAEMPRAQTLLLVGDDRDLFVQIAAALGKLGLGTRFLSPLGNCGPQVETITLVAGLERADAIVHQFPGSQAEHDGSLHTTRWQAQHALERIIAVERERPKSERRLIVLVNAAHTALQDTFLPAMSYTAIPFTARLRHGFVTLAPSGEVEGDIPAGKLLPYLPDDLSMVRQLVGKDDVAPGWERLSLELPDMVEHAGLATSDPQVTRLLEAAWSHVQASAARCVVPPLAIETRDTTQSRLCAAIDWEEPRWLAQASRSFGGAAVYAQGARSRWTWERASFLRSLRAHVEEADRPWILVITNGPDCLSSLASYHGYRVAYATWNHLALGLPEQADGWAEALRIWHMIGHSDVVPLSAARSRGADRFAAVLLAGTDISGGGLDRYQAFAKVLDQHATPDAFVSIMVQVHLNHGTGGGALPHAGFRDAFAEDGIARRIAIGPVDEIDARIPIDAAVRFAPEDQSQYVPGISFGWGDSMVTLGMINGRRGAIATPVRSAPDAARVSPPVRAGSVETAKPVVSSGPIPADVIAAAQAACGQVFACRVIPGFKRNLAQFQTRIDVASDADWWVLPLDIGSAASLTVTPGVALHQIALIDETGRIATPGLTADDEPVTIAPSAPARARQALVFASSRGAVPSAEVA